MPTLDDAPIIPKLTSAKLSTSSTPAGGTGTPTEAQLSKLDLIQIYDSSQQKVKTVTVNDLAVAFGIALV
jgi:hypothetical protein